ATAGQIVTFAGDAHQATHALDGVVVAGTVPVGTSLAEAGDGAVDQTGVDATQGVGITSVARHVAHLVILDEHIGGGRQFADQRLAFRPRDVAGDGALVAVGAQVVGGLAGVVAVPALQEGRAPTPGVVAAGMGRAGWTLDLDHIGAQIGEGLRAPGASEYA